MYLVNCLIAVRMPTDRIAVRRYVEGMTESSQLLDLLSVAGTEEIEPTTAVAARQALYPDVNAPWWRPFLRVTD